MTRTVSTIPRKAPSNLANKVAGGSSALQPGNLLANLGAMWQASGLKQKLLFTLLMMAVFRFGILVPVWGVNPQALTQLGSNQLLGFLDMFSGGAITSVSLMALGIGPYITSSIMVQLLSVVVPKLEEMQKEEGEAGRKKLSQYTRYLTVVLAILQSFLIIKFIASIPGALQTGVSPMVFYPIATLSLVAGSLFSLWVSELITDRGIGNGASLLIFMGIISRIPQYASQTATFVGGDAQKSFALVVLMGLYLVTIALIIILQEATRKVFIVAAKRQVGNKVYGGQNTFIPFKINPAGVMPIIFSFAVLAFPSTIVGLLQQNHPTGLVLELVRFYGRYLAPGSIGYILSEFSLIVFFTFFYTSIIPSMQPKEIADNLKKYGSSIPGIKPGKPTGDALAAVLSKTTFIGAVGLAGITLLASSATSLTGISTLQGLGSTSLIILVGVALDTVNQIKVHLLARQYQGFLK
jgi:preprotein translocase subunit SecY